MRKIERLTESDLPAVAELEKQVFPDPWSLQSLKGTCRLDSTILLGAQEEGTLIGYLLARQLPPEGEILRIAVEAGHRRQGVAQELLEQLFAIGNDQGITRWLLEVRSGNQAARAFYEANGFRTDGFRKQYYENPAEDALLMSLGEKRNA